MTALLVPLLLAAVAVCGVVRRSRYALPAALTADFVGFLAAALAVRLFF